MMIGSMSDFPSIQGEGSLLNLKSDEGKWGGVSPSLSSFLDIIPFLDGFSLRHLNSDSAKCYQSSTFL